MLNLTQLRKDNAAKSNDLQKQKRDHEKRVRDHEKRLNDLKEILLTSQQNAADLKGKIETVLIDGGSLQDLKEELHSEELNISAYTGAITALGFAIDRENELLRGISNSLAETDREELNCKLIETARVYNRIAAELAKTMQQFDSIVDSMGGCDLVKTVYAGSGSIAELMAAHNRIPIAFIRGSDGEDLSEEKRTQENSFYFWNAQIDSIEAKKRIA